MLRGIRRYSKYILRTIYEQVSAEGQGNGDVGGMICRGKEGIGSKITFL